MVPSKVRQSHRMGEKCLQVVFGEGPASGIDKEVTAKLLVRRALAKQTVHCAKRSEEDMSVGTNESVGWCWGGHRVTASCL